MPEALHGMAEWSALSVFPAGRQAAMAVPGLGQPAGQLHVGCPHWQSATRPERGPAGKDLCQHPPLPSAEHALLDALSAPRMRLPCMQCARTHVRQLGTYIQLHMCNVQAPGTPVLAVFCLCCTSCQWQRACGSLAG